MPDTPPPPPPPNPPAPDPNAPPTPPAPAPAPPPTPPPSSSDPTPAQVAEAVARELGMSVADAKKAIKAKKDAELAAMSEAERVRAEAAEATTKAAEATARAAKVEHDAKVSLALMAAGVPAPKLEWARRLVALEPGADDKAVEGAIAAAKAAVPEVFAAGAGDGTPPPPGTPPAPGSNPPGSPAPPKPTPNVREKAAELIKARFPQPSSSSPAGGNP